jgi:hypothetical protein
MLGDFGIFGKTNIMEHLIISGTTNVECEIEKITGKIIYLDSLTLPHNYSCSTYIILWEARKDVGTIEHPGLFETEKSSSVCNVDPNQRFANTAPIRWIPIRIGNAPGWKFYFMVFSESIKENVDLTISYRIED